MVTNSETQRPLANWLSWLRCSLHLPDSPKFMIDYSSTEMAAISTAFISPEIRIYLWHMLRAMRNQINCKISAPVESGDCSSRGSQSKVIRKTAIHEFMKLVNTKTNEKFNEVWNGYKEKYGAHQYWLNYIESSWMKHSNMWWSGNRIGLLDINTNNYIGSWHNILKSGYLGESRKQRTDFLIHVLLREVLPNFTTKVARVIIGLDRRRYSESEKQQLQKCAVLDSELAKSMIHRSAIREGDHYLEVLGVKSFTNEAQEYVVSLNAASVICRCSCDFMIKTNLVCKHMFLAQKVFGLSICLDTRLDGIADTEDSSPHSLERQVSSVDDEVNHEDYKRELAFFSEEVKSFLARANSITNVRREEMKSVQDLRAHVTTRKRIFDADEKSWSIKHPRRSNF